MNPFPTTEPEADVIYTNLLELLDDESYYSGPSTVSVQTCLERIRLLMGALRFYRKLCDAQKLGLEMLHSRHQQACQTLREHHLID